ncbi:hypothetical protein SKAU_G00302930 [Synaphobranchus kaupii]|uniref:Secreted protein n=1 Tax=Synaphobranchus kaupii TaxID=118154 RepID=A0A9Q1EW33_SYNKA|nr:hypothetical protein SKAU_G00302930 [Synaphobranchus kaupii]
MFKSKAIMIFLLFWITPASVTSDLLPFNIPASIFVFCLQNGEMVNADMKCITHHKHAFCRSSLSFHMLSMGAICLHKTKTKKTAFK